MNKIFFIEHTDKGLVMTDFANDYKMGEFPDGTFSFDRDDEYTQCLTGCKTIDDLADAAADNDFRIIDDPKNRARERNRFGREIVETRKRLGVSQSELAARSGIKVANLTSIENGRYSASFDNINAIAKALGLKLRFA